MSLIGKQKVLHVRFYLIILLIVYWFLNTYTGTFCFLSTGSGDIDTSKVVKADADGHICGASG